MKNLLRLLMVFLTLGPLSAAENPAHEELRTLRLTIIDAINKGDIDGVIKHIHPDAVITWQNSEVCRGQKGLRSSSSAWGKNPSRATKCRQHPMS